MQLNSANKKNIHPKNHNNCNTQGVLTTCCNLDTIFNYSHFKNKVLNNNRQG